MKMMYYLGMSIIMKIMDSVRINIRINNTNESNVKIGRINVRINKHTNQYVYPSS